MDAQLQKLFDSIADYRQQIRAGLYIEGMTADWIVAQGKKTLDDAAMGKRPSRNSRFTEEMVAKYLGMLPDLISQIQDQNLRCENAWNDCAGNSQQDQFFTERAKLIGFFGKVRISDAELGGYRKSNRRFFVERVRYLVESNSIDSAEAVVYESRCRMTLKEFLLNSKVIASMVSGMQKVQHQNVPYFKDWALGIAESSHPQNEAAKGAALQGLLRATTYFDRSAGYKFESYALWWVNQAMLQLTDKS